MPLQFGIVASSFSALPPIVTTQATTNFNQDIATFNANVDGNGGIGTGYFEYSTVSNFSTFSSTSTVSFPATSVSVFANVTGLSINTTYYVRFRATNSGGTTIGSSVNFTTWSLKTATFTSSGSQTIQTVTPTGGSAVVPTIYDIFVVGGGGGGSRLNQAAGGGGAYSVVSSQAFNNASSLSLTITVGGGGAYFTGNTGAGNSGGASSITGSSFTTVSAAGGLSTPDVSALSSGASGNGNAAGGAAFQIDLKGDGSVSATGGGGGAGGVGGNGSINPNATFGVPTGGSGGAGYTSSVYSITVGSGGGGGVDTASTQGGSRGSTPSSSYGGGGYGSMYLNKVLSSDGIGGQGGLVKFKYYGP